VAKWGSPKKTRHLLCDLTSVTASKLMSQWVCESQPCLREFRENFPNVDLIEVNFVNIFNYVVKILCETDHFERKSGSG
jgi:hypothetical protein